MKLAARGAAALLLAVLCCGTGARAAGGEVSVPVHFHVVSAGDRYEDGNAPMWMIEGQVDVLNRAFAKTPFRFRLAGVTRAHSPAWYALRMLSAEEALAKRTLRVGGPDALNVWTVGMLDRLYLGWATFPENFEQFPAFDGVVIDWRSMPGGPYERFNQGLTLAHEAGHWLGVRHYDRGPATSQCQSVNYMDATERDACLRAFTAPQVEQMKGAYAKFRDPARKEKIDVKQ